MISKGEKINKKYLFSLHTYIKKIREKVYKAKLQRIKFERLKK